MDFFGEQARAQKKTRWLVFGFVLVVIILTVAIYLAVTLIFGMTGGGTQAIIQPENRQPGFFHGAFWDASRFFTTLFVVGGVIGLASLYKIREISRMGGALIAIELGGRPVLRETRDALELQLVNVIDEMSIAAGIPAPKAFVLDEEAGLNAFAAGMTTNNSVIAVTRGLLDHLDRDQLQGVIGHEISHIVNGDTRLNLRIIGVLHGIFFLTTCGRFMTKARGRNSGGAIPLGVLLMIIGSVGLFFGKLIQASISRAREYLADASAVQFTRNPDGLARALRQLMVSGSQIQHPRSEAASHLFFGASGRRVFSLFPLFATHPPLEERIVRVDKNFKGTLSKRQPAIKPRATAPDAKLSGMALPDAKLAGVSFMNGIGAFGSAQLAAAQTLLAGIPEPLAEAAHLPDDAQAIVYALLLSRDAKVQKQQLEDLRHSHFPEQVAETLRHAQWLAQQGAQYRLPLLDLALPALRELSPEAQSRFLQSVDTLIWADGRLSIAEFTVRRILKSVLEPDSKIRPPLRMERLKPDITHILALLAYAGNADQAAAAAAFHHAAALAPIDGPWEFPDKKAVRPNVVDAALEHLAHTAPHFRKNLLAACVAVTEHDGKITVAEFELLRALAQSLDCPAPLTLMDERTHGENRHVR
ncbi:MAG: M48 family metallopeptidase [Zoogloeaceae bacterium]|jgi:Zn-dependent protease with chaperone function|nr:M48 family metallopeptidase [Zoogloeaceae bacterium]